MLNFISAQYSWKIETVKKFFSTLGSRKCFTAKNHFSPHDLGNTRVWPFVYLRQGQEQTLQIPVLFLIND